MSTNPQVAQLTAALQAVQSDVNSLLSKAQDLESKLQDVQSQQSSQQSQTDTVDLSGLLSLAASIRSSLEGTASTVQDHVDNASADQGGSSDALGNAQAASADQGGSSEAQPNDGTTQEQTVIGEGGQPVSSGGSSGDDSSQQGAETE